MQLCRFANARHGLADPPDHADKCPGTPNQHGAHGCDRREPQPAQSAGGCNCTGRPGRAKRDGQALLGTALRAATGTPGFRQAANRRPRAAAGSTGQPPARSAVCLHPPYVPAKNHCAHGHQASSPAQPPASQHAGGLWARVQICPGTCYPPQFFSCPRSFRAGRRMLRRRSARQSNRASGACGPDSRWNKPVTSSECTANSSHLH